MTTHKGADFKSRVTALLRKANNSAASEAEAQACINKAFNLMARHGLSMQDVAGQEAEEVGESATPHQPGRVGDAMTYVYAAIAAFTATRAAHTGNARSGTRMEYYGYGSDRQLALWLHGHIRSAIEAESKLYNPTSRAAARRAKERRSFSLLMAHRISERLLAMSEALDDATRGSGTDVMIVKNAKLDEYFAGLGIPPARNRRRTICSEGAEAGRAAGDKVSLHRPVEDENGPLRITSP